MYVNNERDALTVQAEQGDVKAQYELAKLWEQGDAVHWVKAYYWYSLAAKHGHEQAARECDRVGSHLSTEQRSATDKHVSKWIATALPQPPPRFHGDANASTLTWLQAWYQFHANDDWREEYGVKIETLANPGWSLRIDLVETYLETKPFSEIHEDRGEEDWMFCRVTDCTFEASGDPSKLQKMIEVFRSWASSD
jgi:hypothetical protein